jgi:CubicO group peptidase (beta-lactamase class C family)
MWRRKPCKTRKPVQWVARLELLAFLHLLPLAALSGEIGVISVSVEYGNPVLCWLNSPGQAYVIETTTNLAMAPWQERATITTESSDLAWADNGLPRQQAFYRVALTTNSTVFQKLQQALHRACTNQGIVGASAAVFLPDEGLWLGTYGSSDGLTPIRPQTPFEIGSVTKTLVATTVLRLAEEGRLNLDDTVGQWLPNLDCANVSPSNTIRQLLGHRAGIYNVAVHRLARRRGNLLGRKRTEPETSEQRVARM